MHRDSLCNSLYDALQSVTITADEVKALAPDADEHYCLAMDSGNDTQTFVPPFEVFPTKISASTNNE